MAIPRTHRLKGTNEFQKVMNKGRKFVFNELILFSLIEKDIQILQIGIIASKKVGNAVERNRAKRLVREAFKTILSDLVLNQKIVIICRSTILSAKSPKIHELIDSIDYLKKPAPVKN